MLIKQNVSLRLANFIKQAYTQVNSKIGFWRRRLCLIFFTLSRALPTGNGRSLRSKNLRSLLAKLPIFEFTWVYASLFLPFCISLTCYSHSLYGANLTEPATITYYLYITDFANSFIQIPTSNVSGDSSTIASSYLAGRAPIYNANNVKAGVCSASFLSMQTPDGVYTDISNYLSAADGLIVTWFTPTTLLNLELDSIINSMVTECTVTATTKVGFAPLFGQTFDLIVSSDGEKIYFRFSRIGAIF